MRQLLSLLTLLYIAHIEHENNYEDESTEDVQTLLVLYFPSTFDKYFSGVSTIITSNELCRQDSRGEDFSVLSTLLLPTLTIILLINNKNRLCDFWNEYLQLYKPYVMIMGC